jgi:DNA-binding NarL/FixJ family response regulator
MRFFLYADEPIVCEAMRLIFAGRDDIVLETTLDATDQILPAVQQSKPDLLLLSLTPALHLSLLVQLRETVPDCRMVLWARSPGLEIAHQAMELGIRGILPRTCSTELLLKCLHKVHEGELWFDRQLTASHSTYCRVALTPRQAQLAQMVAEGRRNKEIAAGLSISEGAVKVYLSHLFEKVGTKDRTELANLVMRNLQSVEYHEQFRGPNGVLQALYVDSALTAELGLKPQTSLHQTAE